MDEQNSIIQTPYGIFGAVTWASYFPNTQRPSALKFSDKNIIVTHAGELVLFYGPMDHRRKDKPAVTFYEENGMVQSVSLQEQQELLTPVGELPGEFISFYESGEVKNILILDGRISGFWSEEEEKELNVPLTFEFDFASFTAYVSGIMFYRSGAVRSMTLFPGEQIDIRIGQKKSVPARYGFSLYESGALKSFEPASSAALSTPIGVIHAYDLNANGVTGDINSLGFTEDGKVRHAAVSSDQIAMFPSDGSPAEYFTPAEIIHTDDGEEQSIVPLLLDFDYGLNTVAVTSREKQKTFSIDDASWKIVPLAHEGFCTPDACASCSLGCKSKNGG